MRVYELAKELGKSNKDIMVMLQGLGLPTKSHSSTIDDFYVEKLKALAKAPVPAAKPKGLQIMGVVRKADIEAKAKAAEAAAAQAVVEAAAAPAPEASGSVDHKPAPADGKHAEGHDAPMAAPSVRHAITDPSKRPASTVSKLDLIRKLDSVERKERMRRQKEIKDGGVAAPNAAVPDFNFGGLGAVPRPQDAFKPRRRGGGRSRKSKFVEEVAVDPQALTDDQYRQREARTIDFAQDVVPVKDLAVLIDVPLAQIMKELLLRGVMINLNSQLDINMAREIARVFQTELSSDVKAETRDERSRRVVEEHAYEQLDQADQLVARPPVVAVMGHVDHGKTKLLDKIRSANVVATESGGITQHIGAYQVVANQRKITFLDTPGHEAFTTLRARGAQVTDIAILVVAADDGVMPQTIEAMNHAKAAGVPIIVAINKVDKESANIDNVKQQLSQYELVAEEWGGKTVMVPVSAVTGKGIQELLDMVLLTADLHD